MHVMKGAIKRLLGGEGKTIGFRMTGRSTQFAVGNYGEVMSAMSPNKN